MAVKVILKQTVPNLGEAGEIKQVAPGYFRNFLLPRGLAVEATKSQLAALQADKSIRESRRDKVQAQTNALAQRLSTVALRIPVRLGEQGRIYGSVTNKDIAEALQQQESVSIDRHKIELSEPLKTIGSHAVPVRIEQGVDAHITVELIPDTEQAEV